MGLNSGFHGVKPTLLLLYKVTLHVIMICKSYRTRYRTQFVAALCIFIE